MDRLALVLASLGLSFTLHLSAQEAPALRPGQMVRATPVPAGSAPVVGFVVAVNGREMVLEVERFGAHHRVDTRNVAVSLDSLRSLEVSTGRRGHFAAGLGIGAVVGAATFGLGSAALFGRSCSSFACITPGDAAMAGGLAGGLVGGLIGAASGTELWASLPLGGARVGLVVDPRGRPGLGAAIGFW